MFSPRASTIAAAFAIDLRLIADRFDAYHADDMSPPPARQQEWQQQVGNAGCNT